ncbi:MULTISPECIES: type III polyketide synthase [Allobacillus]|uniref:Type III polyketide synthase n=1 Tax=Allobacillus salarius TaxID=1955272 RepID=A0A556PT20_9BACI|nr:3-oxoacyl-[acyl-carrier-protein] synthase III C-terminal domain-containing protein [Allobacillus salarius]TSJ67527.1 type III polyketide synthase [Allobacillus salarius]
MAMIHSIGTAVPEQQLTQEDAKNFISSFVSDRRLRRFLNVFDQADISKRHFVVHPSFFKKRRSFQERNKLYEEHGVQLAYEAVTNCMNNQRQIQLADIDAIITVNSTGILTPTLDAELINRLDLNNRITRLPLFGLGCAGGASGLSRAYDYLKAYPTKSVLLVATELASVAFHPDDLTPKDIVGAAIFSDGAGAVLLLGANHPSIEGSLQFQLTASSSRIKKNSMDLMGWDVKDDGFHVIFSREIPELVNTFWKDHLDDFLSGNSVELRDINQMIAHPGGKKILKNIEELLYEHQNVLLSSTILQQYGNMSSATVLFVLEAFLNEETSKKEGKNLVTALGPGFSSEMLLLERIK